MSMMVSFCAVFFPRGVLDEILNLIESVSEGFPSYFCTCAHFTSTKFLNLKQASVLFSFINLSERKTGYCFFG